MKSILIVIDDIEFKYFEFNKLVTNFWLIYEYLLRGYRVDITLKSNLFLVNNKAHAKIYNTYIKNDDIKKSDDTETVELEGYDIIFMRPDPPVDMSYIEATYILSYVDKTKTLIMNSPESLREKNEKLYINEFKGIADEFIPDNIVSSDEKIIKEFLFENHEIIIKPLNRCFGSGVFYLNDSDKNINAILQTATNNFKTPVMVQVYLPKVQEGDKRLVYICGKIYDYAVQKVATNNDFKFNEHNKDTLKYTELTPKEKQIESIVKEKFEHDGIYLAGLDVIDGKIIEINITSPCFFINEINEIFKINFEKMIVDRIEGYANSTNSSIQADAVIC